LEALLWLAVIGSASSVFLLTLAGGLHTPNGNATAGGGPLGLVLWCYLIAKVRRIRKAWLYGFAGLGLAFFIIVVARIVAMQLH
jgi:hypothetical protein